MCTRTTPVHSIVLITAVFFMASSPTIALQPAAGGRAAPPDPKQMAEDALAKIEGGDLQGGVALLQRARKLAPDLELLKLVEGMLYVTNNQGPQAVGILEEYNRTDEGKVDYRGFAAVGGVYLRSRMLRQAMPALEAAKGLAPLEKDGKPVRARIAIDLALNYLRLKSTEKALETVREARSAAPNDGETQFRVSQIAMDAGSSELALEAAQKAITLLKAGIRDEVFDSEAHVQLKGCYDVLGRLYTSRIEQDPDVGENYVRYAEVLLRGAEVVERINKVSARDVALQAIEKDPKNSQWQLFVAKIEFELGGIADAVERVEALLRENPNDQAALDLKQQIAASPPRPNLFPDE